MVALRTCSFVLKVQKPKHEAYPKELETIGDHIRAKRMDLGLLQKDVANIFNVCEATLTGWELNRFTPTHKYFKSIVTFLGYVPKEWREGSLGTRLKYARLLSGLTQEQLAKRVGCDESNLRVIELNKRTPRNETLIKVTGFIQDSFLLKK
ncbi:MAG: hypothetical protein POELPBGB_01388 [Bacteroidia bacterium]|nr:hypothetical protein [Bacteroidia bacterium]